MHPSSQEKPQIGLVETVHLKFGSVSAWLRSTREGVVRQSSEDSTIEAIRQSFMARSQDKSNTSEYVAIIRKKGEAPYLLLPQAFDQLCSQLADKIECGAANAMLDDEMPLALQAYMSPADDLRYITTMSFDSTDGRDIALLSSQTYQRKFSAHFLPLGLSSIESQIVVGAVQPLLKVRIQEEARKLVNYLSSKHGLVVSRIVCEHIRDEEDAIQLLSVMSIEYLSVSQQKNEVNAPSMVPSQVDEPVFGTHGELEATIISTNQDQESQQVARHSSSTLVGSAGAMNVIPPWLQPSTPLIQSPKKSRLFSANPKSRGATALQSSRPISASPFSSAKKALGIPLSVLTANGLHANGSRPSSASTGAPAIIKRLADEVESLKEKLKAKGDELETTEERLIQSELGRKRDAVEHGTVCTDLRRQKDELREEISQLKATTHELQVRAEIAEGKLEIIEQDKSLIRCEYQDEISSALRSLKTAQLQNEQFEAEVLRMNEQLRSERTPLSLQATLSYDNSNLTAPSGLNSPHLIEAMSKIEPLIKAQENPEGEGWGVKKLLLAHEQDCKELFLYFSQLGSSIKQWPPALSHPQWLLFCTQHGFTESKQSSLISPHPRFTGSLKKLPSSEIDNMFLQFSETELVSLSPAIAEKEPMSPIAKSPKQRQYPGFLTLSSFLACLIAMSEKITHQRYLAESLSVLLTLITSKGAPATLRPASPLKSSPASPAKSRVKVKPKTNSSTKMKTLDS